MQQRFHSFLEAFFKSFHRPVFLPVLLVAASLCLAVPATAQVDVTIGGAAALNGGSARVSISGDLDNQGAFAPGQSTVVFDGADAQTVSGVSTFSGLGVDKPGGSFSLGGSVTVADNLELTAGTLDNSGGVVVALGDGATIRRSAGALAAAPNFGATVNIVYEGDAPVSTGKEVPAAGSGTAVQDFTVSNTGGVTLTEPVEVSGTLALEEGDLDNTQAQVVVAEGAHVEPGSGEISETPDYEGEVHLTYDGATARTTGTELPSEVASLTVSNPAGITLGKDLSVTEVLAVQTGGLDLGGKTITLGADAQLVEAAGATVSGASGQIQATRLLDAPQTVDVAGLGFKVTSNADLGATTVIRTHTRPLTGDPVSAQRMYDVEPASGDGLGATLTLAYDESELGDDFHVDGTLQEAPLEVYHSTDGGSTWTRLGGTADPSTNTVTVSGVDGFSRFTVGAARAALPVELAGKPQARVDEFNVVLTWRTLSETSNMGFEVQHRAPGASAFEKVGFVEGGGTTNEPQDYQHRVASLDVGTHTFRLRQVDAGGVATFSPEVEATVGLEGTHLLSATYPNPFRTRARFKLAVRKAQNVTVEVYDMLGRHVSTVFDGPVEEQRTREFDLRGDRLSSGVYFLRVRGEHFTETQKMVLMR